MWGRRQLIAAVCKVCQGCVAMITGENVKAYRELLASGANSLLSKKELSNEEICLRDHNTIKVNKAAELLDSNWNSWRGHWKDSARLLGSFIFSPHFFLN